jgi:large subunit ribosomal protein L17
MSHRRVGRKLGVVTKHRISMFRNMVTDLLRHESIKTTDTRAKELRRFAEKMITLAKKGTLHSRRQAAAFIRDRAVLKKLFDELAQKYKNREGGYTRIIKFGFRKGDNAPVSIIELVEEEVRSKGKKKTKKSKLKEPLPATEGAEVRSSKKEAAEELGLIEKKKKTGVEEPKAEDEPVGKEAQEPAEKPQEIAAEAAEAGAGVEFAEGQVEETQETPEAKVEESSQEPEAKEAGSEETVLEKEEPKAEEEQASGAKADGGELKDESTSEDSTGVEPEETKKDS